jgi:RNA polymerase sigma-70 factor, ECF subfamily
MVVLRDVQGLNYAEIAAATNRPVGTVKSKLSRARTKLRADLGPGLSAPA